MGTLLFLFFVPAINSYILPLSERDSQKKNKQMLPMVSYITVILPMVSYITVGLPMVSYITVVLPRVSYLTVVLPIVSYINIIKIIIIMTLLRSTKISVPISFT